MNEIEVGSYVRVIDPEKFIYSVKMALRNRVGTVTKIFIPAGSNREIVRVDFPPRRKGGKPHHEFLYRLDLEVVEDDNQ